MSCSTEETHSTSDRHRTADDPSSTDTANERAIIGEAAGPAVEKGRGVLWRRLLANLIAGVNIAAFRRVGCADLNAGAGDLVLLAAADLLLNFLTSYLLVGPGGEWSFTSLTTFFFHLPLMLLLGYLAGVVGNEPHLVTVVPTALVAASIPLELCHGVLEGMSQVPRFSWLEGYLDSVHYYRFFGWWAVASALFLFRRVPVSSLRRAGLSILFLVVLVAPLWYVPRGDTWVSLPENAEGGELHLTDQVLGIQAHLLDNQLAEIRPGMPGNPGLFFVGVAGDSTQDVFTKEVTSVARLFATCFGAAGRTLILANNPRTATTLPFATTGNLKTTLDRLGRIMNRDEDVLFLFLSSHGLPEHALVVDNPPLELENLSPARLRDLLARSGIIWKVIVVSSCYSGGFLEPLKDDHTLVITAADSSHASFGCDYGEDFTWFGKAYFDDALRRNRSFVDAFGQARNTLIEWEQREGEVPSNPQIWVGPAMERHLKKLEERVTDHRPEGY